MPNETHLAPPRYTIPDFFSSLLELPCPPFGISSCTLPQEGWVNGIPNSPIVPGARAGRFSATPSCLQPGHRSLDSRAGHRAGGLLPFPVGFYHRPHRQVLRVGIVTI